MWDCNQDHPARRYKTLSAFFKALAAAERSGGGYRVAYCGEPSPENFELWCRGVWSILDGEKITYLLVEEYADCCAGAGPINPRRYPFHRRLWIQARKYGGIFHATSQRPQLISKDALGNAGIIWAGHMDSGAAERVGREIDVHRAKIQACKTGEFYRWDEKGEAIKQSVFVPL